MALIVGGLYPHPDYLPQPTQPGGTGTPVTDPSQTVDEHQGQFMPGCTHSINTWMLIRDGVDGVPSDIVCCPMCGWIQQIQPAGFFDNVPIIIG